MSEAVHEVRVYKRPLSVKEISAEYQEKAKLFP
jgi:hypothetical protein